MSGDDHIYPRGKRGILWGRIQVDGKDIRRSLRTIDRKEARKRRDKMIAEAEHIRFHGEERHTWKQAVVEWAAVFEGADRTKGRYLTSLGQLDGILGSLYIDEITGRTIAKIAKRPGITNRTRKNDLTAVSSVLAYCVSQLWREDNPAKAFDRTVIKTRHHPIVLPEAWEIDAMVQEAPGNFSAMICFAVYTGMRQEEIASLKRDQVDRQREAANLRKTKRGRVRSVPLDERALTVISETTPRLNCPWVFWHPGDKADDPATRYLNVSSRFGVIRARVRRKAKEDGKPVPRHFKFHDLRHWYAVDYLRKGGNIYDLQKILGHSSIKTTELYLDYLTPEEAERAKRGERA